MMEQENSEKRALFENIKSEIAKQRKNSNILFLIWCLILSAGLVVCAVKHYDLVGQLVYSALFVGALLLGLHSSHWLGKMANAATVQELLTVYNKNWKIEKWKVILFYSIASILSLFYIISLAPDAGLLPYLMLITAIAASSFRGCIGKKRDDIDGLRDA